jgi:mannose-6-phosphate isomerase-like protein (cupin superfamily)
MNILSHSAIPVYSLPGLQHQTIARKSDGTQAVETWKQTLAPGAATPPHFHECEEVIYILQGMGEIAIEGKTVPFAADCTLILPPGPGASDNEHGTGGHAA